MIAGLAIVAFLIALEVVLLWMLLGPIATNFTLWDAVTGVLP